MISQELRACLMTAMISAKVSRHEFFTVEHLLLALLEDSRTVEILQACSIDIDKLKISLSEFINAVTPLVTGVDSDPRQSLGCFRSIQRAKQYNPLSTTGAHLLVGIFGERDSQAVDFLTQEVLTRQDVIDFVVRGMTKPSGQNKSTGQEENFFYYRAKASSLNRLYELVEKNQLTRLELEEFFKDSTVEFPGIK